MWRAVGKRQSPGISNTEALVPEAERMLKLERRYSWHTRHCLSAFVCLRDSHWGVAEKRFDLLIFQPRYRKWEKEFLLWKERSLGNHPTWSREQSDFFCFLSILIQTKYMRQIIRKRPIFQFIRFRQHNSLRQAQPGSLTAEQPRFETEVGHKLPGAADNPSVRLLAGSHYEAPLQLTYYILSFRSINHHTASILSGSACYCSAISKSLMAISLFLNKLRA